MSNSTQANDAYMQFQQHMRFLDAKYNAVSAGLSIWEVGDQVDITLPNGDMLLVRVKALCYDVNLRVWRAEFENV